MYIPSKECHEGPQLRYTHAFWAVLPKWFVDSKPVRVECGCVRERDEKILNPKPYGPN